MPTTTGRRLRRPFAVLAVLTLLAAGCVKSSDSSETGSMTLNVGQISNSVAFLPLFVAEDKGYFAEEGLTLGERPRLGTGAKLAAALHSGSIDVAGGVMTDVLNLHKTNDQARIIGSLVDTYYVDIIAGNGIPQSTDTAPLADRIKALEGKKIGITGPGSGTEALVNYLLHQVGLDPKRDVTTVNLGSDASAAIGALKQQRVDALSFFQPVGQLVAAAQAGRLYISPARGDVPELKSATHGVVFTTQSVLDDKSEAVAAFLRAIAKAEALIRSDAAAVGELLAKYQPNMDPATVQELVPILQEEVAAGPQPQQAGYDASVSFHLETGLVPAAPGFAEIVPGDWITSALNGS
nr:ABC transporter substrate-binding protein [Micromonospora sp. DSM 115978]